MFGKTRKQILIEAINKADLVIKSPDLIGCYYKKVKKGKIRYKLEISEYEDGTTKCKNLGRY